MKRSPLLQPFSREHHSALTLAKACELAARSGDAAEIFNACQRAIREFSEGLEPHFQIEEHTLLPLLNDEKSQPLAQRTLAEHRQLRAFLCDLQLYNAEALGSFGRCLAAHVRFEERVLFAALEGVLNESERQ